MSWSWLAFGLPLGVNTIEGSEAALLLAASAARAGWRRAISVATLGVATLAPMGAVVFFLYQSLPDAFIDYGIAAVIFVLGALELREGLEERGKQPSEEEPSKEEKSSERVWPAYVGVVLEGGEALIYTFAVASSSSSWLAATTGGLLGFGIPFLSLAALRRLAGGVPKWKQEIGIGLVLMTAAAMLVILRVAGLLGG